MIPSSVISEVERETMRDEAEEDERPLESLNQSGDGEGVTTTVMDVEAVGVIQTFEDISHQELHESAKPPCAESREVTPTVIGMFICFDRGGGGEAVIVRT